VKVMVFVSVFPRRFGVLARVDDVRTLSPMSLMSPMSPMSLMDKESSRLIGLLDKAPDIHRSAAIQRTDEHSEH
jgi:hypothetical protein